MTRPALLKITPCPEARYGLHIQVETQGGVNLDLFHHVCAIQMALMLQSTLPQLAAIDTYDRTDPEPATLGLLAHPRHPDTQVNVVFTADSLKDLGPRSPLQQVCVALVLQHLAQANALVVPRFDLSLLHDAAPRRAQKPLH